MGTLIHEGKILAWGQSQSTEEEIRRAHAVMPITAIRREFSGADVKDVVTSVTASAYGVVGVQDGLANLTCVVV